jgi:hypothetical protein
MPPASSGKPIKMFRKEPSREFVDGILKEFGFLGFHDLRWFSKDEIRLSTIDEWLPTLEAYYLPCKAKRFIHNWTNGSVLTIMRHLLHCHGYTLQKEERLYKGVKQMLYQIQSGHSIQDLSGTSLQVDFL